MLGVLTDDQKVSYPVAHLMYVNIIESGVYISRMVILVGLQCPRRKRSAAAAFENGRLQILPNHRSNR